MLPKASSMLLTRPSISTTFAASSVKRVQKNTTNDEYNVEEVKKYHQAAWLVKQHRGELAIGIYFSIKIPSWGVEQAGHGGRFLAGLLLVYIVANPTK